MWGRISIIISAVAVLAVGSAAAAPSALFPALPELAQSEFTAEPALQLAPGLAETSPNDALFILEEATAPFLGPAYDFNRPSSIEIAVAAPGYQDIFTIYFPKGSSHLTLAAEDMVALAAEAVRDFSDAEIWIVADAALSDNLAFSRMSQVQDVLLLNDVPGNWIRIDDGGLEAALDRPEHLGLDTEL